MNNQHAGGIDAETGGVLDLPTVEDLARDVGETRLGAVLGAFADELTRRIPIVRRAIDERDLSTLGRETHSIKGSALTFGAPTLAAAARLANDAARNRAADATFAASREMLDCMPQACGAVRQLIDTRCTRENAP
jgi:HPt (histidine-containing phosphotransfer) domain-containing protein